MTTLPPIPESDNNTSSSKAAGILQRNATSNPNRRARFVEDFDEDPAALSTTQEWSDFSSFSPIAPEVVSRMGNQPPPPIRSPDDEITILPRSPLSSFDSQRRDQPSRPIKNPDDEITALPNQQFRSVGNPDDDICARPDLIQRKSLLKSTVERSTFLGKLSRHKSERAKLQKKQPLVPGVSTQSGTPMEIDMGSNPPQSESPNSNNKIEGESFLRKLSKHKSQRAKLQKRQRLDATASTQSGPPLRNKVLNPPQSESPHNNTNNGTSFRRSLSRAKSTTLCRSARAASEQGQEHVSTTSERGTHSEPEEDPSQSQSGNQTQNQPQTTPSYQKSFAKLDAARTPIMRRGI